MGRIGSEYFFTLKEMNCRIKGSLMGSELNTRAKEKFENISGPCCRHKHEVVRCHRLSTTLFMNVILILNLLHTVASATKHGLHEPLLDVHDVLSRIKTNDESMEISSTANDLQYSQDNLAHGFHEQEISIPVKLDQETGKSVQHGRHFFRKRISKSLDLFNGRARSRSRRSAGSSVDNNSDPTLNHPDLHTAANFSIKAFGEEFHLHLTPYSNFISPTFSLHYNGNVTQGVDAAIEHVPRHCFYTGIVNHEPEHTAVVSLCGGLFGAWRTNDMDYLIEPHDVTKHQSEEHADEEVGTKQHRIYRRRTKRASRKSRKLCAFTESTKDEADKNSFESTSESRQSRRARQPNKRIPLNTPKQHAREINRSRKKRYVSYPRHVEVMVTADNGMLKTHGANLQHYVLTLMAIGFALTMNHTSWIFTGAGFHGLMPSLPVATRFNAIGCIDYAYPSVASRQAGYLYEQNQFMKSRVHHVYLDPSIGNQVNIVFVKLVVIDEDAVRHGPRITKNAHECLRNFCQWQADENDPDDSHPNHHDTAVLITRQDICRTEHACDTLGLAELGTMCDPRRSCSINEDNGLSTAFTIAHELGHEFNAPHDNNEKCLTAAGKPEGMHVMSPTLDHKSKPWSWSTCSARYITNFLDYGNGQCLLDEPPQRKLPLPIEEPGQIYDVNQQCSFVYGKGVTHCGFMTTCARLWCVSADRRHGCRTPHMPWADGTKCGPAKWCQRGQCVPENRDRRPVDGAWGEWSKFGECSLPCGGGIRIAVRECNNPAPLNGGRYCVGKRKKFRSCNAQECQEPRNFRAEQCKSYDWSKNRHIIKGVPEFAEWIPKYGGIMLQDRCKLICQLKREDQYGAPWYVLKPKVINGTPCGPDSHDICVEGICKRAGCDHVLNSNTKEDDCGVCGGDSSGCRAVKGVYNTGKRGGYNIVAEIPAGATNIVIEQRSYGYNPEDNNYLALKDASGKFILNGNRNVVQFEHAIEKSSTSGMGYSYQFDYSGTDNIVEKINSSKAIRENITVLVLAAGALLPPNIKYRYHIPLPEQITYSWDPYGPWSDCSHSCRGHTKRKVLCFRSGDGQIVADHKCHASNKPPSIGRSCNMQCEIKWRIKSQECSTRCGKGRLIYEHECIKLTTLTTTSDSTLDILNDVECTKPKSEKYSVCYGECLQTSWRYGEWSECDRTCGGGAQRRTAVCKDSNAVEQASTECVVRARVISRMCNVFACPQWVTGDFTQCLATCGSGVRRRGVWCRGPSGEVQSDFICNPLRKPPSTVKCHLAPCPTWKYDDWGKCSVTCGSGVTVRIMHCTDYLGRHVDDEQCDEGLREKDIKPCILSKCFVPALVPLPRSGRPFIVNRALSYGRSPEPAAGNEITGRSMISHETRNNRNSFVIERIDLVPERDVNAELEDVLTISGNAQWRTGHWTDCSVTCGGGHRERYVSCRDYSDDEVSEGRCRSDQRPDSGQDCNMTPCYGVWRSGAWSECSASCGEGVKSRYVGCMYRGRYEAEGRCDLTIKQTTEMPCQARRTCPTMDALNDETSNIIVPEVIEPENRISEATTSTPSEGTWRTGPWSECSSSCGNGNRKRAVVCYGNCETLPVPTSVEICDAGPCPRWRSGEWSQCSVSCDRGNVMRTVQCVMEDGIVTSDTRCNVMKRPVDKTPCRTSPCSNRMYRWRSSPWSGCSVTCGRGIKTRQITCVDLKKNHVPDEMCLTVRARRPKTLRKCRIRTRCPKWHTGNWNQCSASCGPGVRVRGVKCRYKRSTVSADMCDSKRKPEHVEPCNGTKCEIYIWKTHTWSSCSESCGVGIMRRRVSCVDGYESLVSDLNCPSGTKPSAEQQCGQESCASFWDVEAWSECSVTCGRGTESRTVRCVYADKRTQRLLPATNCDSNIKPEAVRECNDNNCKSDVTWRVGPWSECSVTCGKGVLERQVLCFNLSSGREVPSSLCESSSGSSPESRSPCSRAPCLPTSCRHAQIRHNARTDGEYYLQIRGRSVQVYCHGMNTRYASEYITLRTGEDENFSEIYRFSLNNSETCPHNGSRNDHCACTGNPQGGKTSFRKIRLDIRSMKVTINDFTFAEFDYGRPVSYGVAGDCYSKAGCPQGQFRVNLNGTGFIVAQETKWSSYGRSAVQRVLRGHDRQTVNGQCGGYCGQCRPDLIRGLRLTLLPET